MKKLKQRENTFLVLVPFYRGAVVFNDKVIIVFIKFCSRPLLSRSGCIFQTKNDTNIQAKVLVPFYRGAVVFKSIDER